MTETGTSILEVRDLETGYGKKQILFSISLDVKRGEIVSLVGPNGAGKSTVLKTVIGLVPVWKGEIKFDGDKLAGKPVAKNVAAGIGFVPQGNVVFDELNVRENLEIGGYLLYRQEVKERIESVFSLFSILRERASLLAGRLSGGEKQMLALGRALVAKPKLLLLDEPSLGLSPSLVKSSFETIRRLNQEQGVSILIVEQKVHKVLEISDRTYVLKMGRVVLEGNSNEILRDKEKVREAFL